MGQSTFDRSCEHWSETSRREMEHFYSLAWLDYRHLAQAVDWVQWFEARQGLAGERNLELLDVACGSGKFPAALLRDTGLGAAAIRPVGYNLLDPSAFSVAEARAALVPPFVPGESFETTLQAFDGHAKCYDIVWATHALYAIPPTDIDAALAQFVAALGKDGAGFIAHACEDAHYLAFYRRYLEAFRAGENIAPYTSAEQVVSALGRLGVRIHCRDIEYVNGAPATERRRVEGYIQRCLFDDRVSLDDLLREAPTGEWLAACQQGDEWQFHQRVKLIFVNDQ